MIERLCNVKGQLVLKRSDICKILFLKWLKENRFSNNKRNLTIFIKMLLPDDNDSHDAITWGEQHLSRVAFEECIFGNIQFDDMTGSIISAELVPIIRRCALKYLEPYFELDIFTI